MAMFGLHITGFVLLQHDNCYYSGRGLLWALARCHYPASKLVRRL